MTFQERYNVTEEEKQALTNRIKKMILGEVAMNAERKAADVVDGLMRVYHYEDEETATIQWSMTNSIGLFITMLGEIRNEAHENSGDSRNNKTGC
jgi:hypothetical protein